MRFNGRKKSNLQSLFWIFIPRTEDCFLISSLYLIKYPNIADTQMLSNLCKQQRHKQSEVQRKTWTLRCKNKSSTSIRKRYLAGWLYSNMMFLFSQWLKNFPESELWKPAVYKWGVILDRNSSSGPPHTHSSRNNANGDSMVAAASARHRDTCAQTNKAKRRVLSPVISSQCRLDAWAESATKTWVLLSSPVLQTISSFLTRVSLQHNSQLYHLHLRWSWV